LVGFLIVVSFYRWRQMLICRGNATPAMQNHSAALSHLHDTALAAAQQIIV
jgi:hypothetical protein